MKKELRVKGRKIIALGLIALMLFVPFSSNLGDKMRTMAEEGNPDDEPEPNEEDVTIDYTLSVNLEDSGEVNRESAATEWANGTEKTGCLRIRREDRDIHEIKLKTLSDSAKIKLKANPSFNQEGAPATLTCEVTSVYRIDGVNGGYKGQNDEDLGAEDNTVDVSVKQKIEFSIEYTWARNSLCRAFEPYDPQPKYAKCWPEELADGTMKEIELSNGQTAHLLARPQIKSVYSDFEITNMELVTRGVNVPEDVNVTFDWAGKQRKEYKDYYDGIVKAYLNNNQTTWITTQNEKALYREMVKYTYEAQDVPAPSDFIWTPSGKNDDGVRQSATFPAIRDPRGENDNDNILIGDIEYAVVSYAENPESEEISKGDGDAATSTDVEPPATSTDVPKSFVPPVPTDMKLWGTEEFNRTAKSGYNYGFAGYVVYDEATKTDKLVKEIAHTPVSSEIDCTPPEIESVGLYKWNDEEGKWELRADPQLTDFEVINPVNFKYRYVIKVKDPRGVNSENVVGYSYDKEDSKHDFYFTKVTDDIMNLGITDTYYYIDLYKQNKYHVPIVGTVNYPTGPMVDSNLREDGILYLYVKAEDSFGNTNGYGNADDCLVKPIASKNPYSNLKIMGLKYYLDNKECEDPRELNDQHTSKKLYIYVKAGAGSEITNMVLYRTTIKDDKEVEEQYQMVEGTSDEDESKEGKKFYLKLLPSDTPEEKCYEATYTFVLPIKDADGYDTNAILKKLRLVVVSKPEDGEEDPLVSEDPDHYKSVEVGNIALDGSAPTFDNYALVKGDDITPINITTDLNKWYSADEIKFEASSGMRDEEDYVSLVQYRISLEDDKNVKKPNDLYVKSNAGYNFSKGQEFSIVTETSQSEKGTYIKLEGRDLAGNEGSEAFNLKIDNDKPKIEGNQVDFVVNEEATTVKSGAKSPAYFATMPDVEFIASDAITLENCIVRVKYPGDTDFSDGVSVKIDKAAPQISIGKTYTIPKKKGETKYEDGTYTVEIVAVDKAGLTSDKCVVSFVLDTKNPVVTLKPITESKKAAGYYSTNTMEVLCTIEDDNVKYSGFILEDEYNNQVKEYVVNKAKAEETKDGYVLRIDGQGEHKFTLKGQDLAGRKAEDKKMTVYLDNQKPILHTSVSSSVSAVNGDYKAPVTVSYSIEDAYKDENDVTGSITRSIAGNTLENTTNLSRLNRAGAFDAEGDYVVTVRTTDLAGNVSADSVETFRVDLNAPQIQILGASANTSNNATVSFEMTEAFYKDATAEVVIYRKPGDGVAESEYKKIQMNLTDTTTRQSETLSETGTYRIVMTARDRAGHTSETNAEFTIDKSAPVITIQGVTDFDKKSDAINVNVEIAEDFYVNKTVSIKGTRKIASGKVESLDFTGSFVPGANPTKFVQEFKEDGIYDLTITATDPIGNSTTKTIHFTIDQTKPVIGDLSKYDNKVMNNFTWDIDTDKLVTDLTVCDVHVYLNGIEYDGSEALEDGAYTLLVTAVDELGHESEATANFVIDTKAPVFIITGVKDGEIKNEPYNITISLQLADDILDSVLLNGQSYTIGENNTVTITVNDGGKYELTLHARDAAGNESEEVISFVFGKEKKFNSIFLIAAIAGGILVIGGIIFIILAKRRKEDDRY